MADVVARSTQPALAAVKLAWWRERLEDLDGGQVAAEPRLQAAARELLPRGVRGVDLASLEEGWAGCLNDPPDMTAIAEHGATLFKLGARLLDVRFDDATIGIAGRLFAGVDAGRRGVIGVVPGLSYPKRKTVDRRARPLTAFAALAMRDLKRGGPPFEPEATPGRAWTLLRHWLTGRFPAAR